MWSETRGFSVSGMLVGFCVIAGGCEKIRFTNGVFGRTFHLLSYNVLR